MIIIFYRLIQYFLYPYSDLYEHFVVPNCYILSRYAIKLLSISISYTFIIIFVNHAIYNIFLLLFTLLSFIHTVMKLWHLITTLSFPPLPHSAAPDFASYDLYPFSVLSQHFHHNIFPHGQELFSHLPFLETF